MLKNWNEMRNIDVLPHCDMREAKDDKGRRIDVPYLNWAKCKELLHKNGAEVVYFEPCVNAAGSSLFMSDQVFTDKNGITVTCSADSRILREWDWFKQNRTCPDAWK
jgi:hypothetical protein